MGKKADAADQKIRTYDRAVDQARAAGNQQAADSFQESLSNARIERLQIRGEE